MQTDQMNIHLPNIATLVIYLNCIFCYDFQFFQGIRMFWIFYISKMMLECQEATKVLAYNISISQYIVYIMIRLLQRRH